MYYWIPPPKADGNDTCIMLKIKIITLTLILCIILPSLGLAKKKVTYENPRLQYMSSEDKDMFNSLTKKQQNDIKQGKIKTGYNAWMVKLAKGAPYYNTEHHPIYNDYEQVWLFTIQQQDKKVTDEKIIDPVTNWPSQHHYVWMKTCQVGDIFVLFDRGVVEKIVKDKSRKVYGSCKITTHEEFIPIVDKKTRKRMQKR